MADTVTSLSLLTLAQNYRGDIVNQINRKAALLRLLKISPGEGKNVAWVPEEDGAIAENYSDGADAANFGGDRQTGVTLNWGLYRSNIHVSSLAMDAAATSSTPLGNRRRWAREVVKGSGKLASLINQKLYSGPGTGTELAGLAVALDDDNTYGGINRLTVGNEYWRANIFDPGASTAPTLKMLRGDLAAIYDACGEVPQIAMVPSAGFNKIASLFDATRRQTQDVTLETPRGAVLIGGANVVDVDGCKFIRDKDATASQIQYLNLDYVEAEFLPAAELAMFGIQQMESDDGFGALPLAMFYEKLAKLGASERAMVRTTVQLKVTRPNSCGQRRNCDFT